MIDESGRDSVLRRLVAWPRFADPDRTAMARRVWGMGWALVGLGLFNSFGPMFLTAPSVRWAVFTIVGLAVGCAVLLLVRAGRVTGGAWLLTVSLWVYGASAQLTAGGLTAPSVSLQIVFILAAGLALGWRVGIAAAVVSVATEFTLAWLQVEGLLPAAGVAHTPWSRAWSVTGYGVAVLVMVGLVIADMRRSRDQAVRELGQRRSAETFLQAVVSSAPGVFYTLDHHGRMVRWNRRLEVITGRSPAALAGLRLVELIAEPDRLSVGEGISRALSDGAAEVEARLLTTQGPRLYVLSGQLVEGVGVRSVAGFGLDITDLREAEDEVRTLNRDLELRVLERTSELQEALAELEAFSYSVSHDLRAPLRGINGYATILETDYAACLDEEGRRELRRIRANSERMGELIDDLLRFSRLGRHRLACGAVDMTALARTAFDDALLAAGSDDVDFTLGPLPSVWGDSALLSEVWSNLLENAVKFTRGRTPRRIVVETHDDGEDHVFSVSDNGVGFDVRYGEKLFNVFERLHGSDYDGTGIGLAICKRIVDAHGGCIWCESRVGEGSTFSFSLSRLGSAGERDAGPAAVAASATGGEAAPG